MVGISNIAKTITKAEEKGLKLKFIALFFLVVLVLGAIKGYQIYSAIKMGSFTPPPEKVTSSVAAELDWEDTFEGVGSLAPTKGTTLSAEESGKIIKINFQSGTPVQEGAILVEIDTSVEEANLKGALAMKLRMLRAYERAQALHQKNAISNDEFDNTSAQFQQTVSQADALAATISRKRIVAPFSGIAGIRTVNLGQFVTPGTPIVPLYSLDELYINFSVPQQLSGLVALGQKITIKVDDTTNKNFEGAVSAINPNIDESSRNISVQGTVKNPTGELRAGMFASVSLTYGKAKRLITIPITSVQYAPYGDSVYVIEKKPDGSAVVHQHIVKVGPKRGDQVAIVDGLKAGDEVVTAGLFKLRPDAAVIINNDVKPSDSQNPTPQDS